MQMPLGDVVSVVDGSLVSRDHIGGVYRVLDFMTGESLMTHQLPRACDEVRPEIIRQQPWLVDVKAPQWDEIPGWDAMTPDEMKAHVFAWLDEQEALHGATVDLLPLHPDDHTSIDPIAELAMMRPDATIIPVIVD